MSITNKTIVQKEVKAYYILGQPLPHRRLYSKTRIFKSRITHLAKQKSAGITKLAFKSYRTR